MQTQRVTSSSGQRPKTYVQAVGNHPDFGWGSVPTGQRASTYDIPEFQAAAGFAAAEMAAIDSAAPEATDLKPYVGVQFAAIPEFPEVGSAFGQEMAAALSGAKSVEDALAAAQAAADAIMDEAGTTNRFLPMERAGGVPGISPPLTLPRLANRLNNSNPAYPKDYSPMANRTLPRLLQAPAVLMLLMWMLVPLGMTLYFSFIRYVLNSLRRPEWTTPRIENWRGLGTISMCLTPRIFGSQYKIVFSS